MIFTPYSSRSRAGSATKDLDRLRVSVSPLREAAVLTSNRGIDDVEALEPRKPASLDERFGFPKSNALLDHGQQVIRCE